MRGSVGIIVGFALAGLAACASNPDFTCQGDAQCGEDGEGAVCQPTGGCSFPDDSCPSGQRYGSYAPVGLAGQCVEAMATGTTTVGSTSGPVATSSVMSSTTFAVDGSTSSPSDSTGPVGSSGPGPTTDSSGDTGEPLDPDLLLWLRFERLGGGVAVDSSTFSFDAQCSDPQCPQPVAGPQGMAAQFDGVDDELTVPFQPELTTPAALSVAAWVRPDVLDGVGSRGVMTKTVGAQNFNSWVLFFHPGLDGDAEWEVSFGLNATSLGLHSYVDLPFALGEWHHLAGTYDGTTAILYVDGVEAMATPLPEPIFDSHPIAIGYDINLETPEGHFDGAMDDLRIYRRVLSADEIAALASP